MDRKLIEVTRLEKGWSREYLSERTGNLVSEATIKRFERRKNYKISNDKLLALLRALGLEINICFNHGSKEEEAS